MATYVFDAYGTLFDIQSVAKATDDAFPGHGNAITQIWRLKQLEYTWLRSLMGQYQNFWQVTRDSLQFAVQAFVPDPDQALLDQVCRSYLTIDLYPEALTAVQGLKAAGHRCAILSNGEPDTLGQLADNAGLTPFLDAILSVDAAKSYKPTPAAYALVEERLGVAPEAVTFVSSNGFDIAGSKAFGFNTVWIRRLDPEAVGRAVAQDPQLGPATLFQLLRMQPETLSLSADHVVSKLTDLLP